MPPFIKFTRTETGLDGDEQVLHFLNCRYIVDAKFYKSEERLEITYDEGGELHTFSLEDAEAKEALKKLQSAR